jgi:RHS repeat-associated protein
MRAAGVVSYLYGDHLGSTSLTTNSSGGGEVRQLYHPYGTVRWSSGALPTDYTFTGQREDAAFGLIHMGARWHSLRAGRWLSADTIVPHPASPQALNRYSYVLGNPLRYTDPSGHWLETAWDVMMVAMDAAFLAQDIQHYQDNPGAPGWEKAVVIGADLVALVVDVACVLVPILPGGGGTALSIAGRGVAGITVQAGATAAVPMALRYGQPLFKGIQLGERLARS